MPRPINPNAPTSSERARASRERHDMRSVQLPARVIAQVDAIRERDGDRTRVAVLSRLVQRALE